MISLQWDERFVAVILAFVIGLGVPTSSPFFSLSE